MSAHKSFALHDACQRGEEDTVLSLLENHDIDVNQVNTLGATPIKIAIKEDFHKIVQHLVDRGAKTSSILLFYAVASGSWNSFHVLLNAKCDPSYTLNNNENDTLLHKMVESAAKSEKRRASCVEAIKHLVLHCGVNINATNKNDNTPLHTLCMFDENIAGMLDLLEFFASKGADLNLKNNNKCTPLCLASNTGNVEEVKMLLKHKAPVDQGIFGIYNAFSSRTKLNEDRIQMILSILVENGANINAMMPLGRTLVHDAPSITLLQFLVLKLGAMINAKDFQSCTPLHSYVAHNDATFTLEAIKFLVDQGANVLDKNGWGRTPLYCLKLEERKCNIKEHQEAILYLEEAEQCAIAQRENEKFRLDLEIELELAEKRQIQEIERRREQQERVLLIKEKATEKLTLERELRRASMKKRMALMIGNMNYSHHKVLNNPGNNIELLSKKFQSIGFEVECLTDMKSQVEIIDCIENFAKRVQQLDDQIDCCLFYYAGHAIQFEGDNYLIPVNANLETQSSVRSRCTSLKIALDIISERCGSNCVQVTLVDACRDEKDFKSTRSILNASSTLCNINPPSGSIIIYSTLEGQKALDECPEFKNNSPFAYALSKALGEEVEIMDLLKTVIREVKRVTYGQQTPYHGGNLDNNFFF